MRQVSIFKVASKEIAEKLDLFVPKTKCIFVVEAVIVGGGRVGVSQRCSKVIVEYLLYRTTLKVQWPGKENKINIVQFLFSLRWRVS